MSYTAEVSLRYDGTLEQLKVAVESVLGVQFPHTERDESGNVRAFCGSLLTMDLVLSTNYLESDREMNFSEFDFVLSTRTGAGYNFRQRLLDLQVPITDTMGLLLCYHLGVESMVTIEVQELYARYNPEDVRS